MTLILTAITPDFAVMASDRRLSTSQGVVTDESGKAGVIHTDDGTAIYAFTGLAELGSFRAKEWIQQALMEASDGTLNETLYGFAGIAQKKFANLAYYGQGITLAVAGFSDVVGPFMGTVSNLEDVAGSFLPRPTKEFQTRIRISPNLSTVDFSGVMANGINQTEYLVELHELNALILAESPHYAVEQKAAHLVRKLADDPRTGGTVGKNLMVSTLHRPPPGRLPVPSATYMPFGEADRIHMLDTVNLRTTGPKIAFRDIEMVFDEGQRIGPKLGRNDKCHCGSGNKFKHCHGR
ncbi:SEC-C metal-binding domain-containing protein [Devosia sp. XGJD_8]|uniref:SEC-C metal-binding domain-containing protein n=1 Tax=Devosia sp. XGJD_8 TaxID=3391187 RepID=UPI0039847F24